MRRLLTACIRLYQLTIAPLLGTNCRFYPSCSEYAIEAINKYGVVKGAAKGFYRVLRCGPWCAGGIDHP